MMCHDLSEPYVSLCICIYVRGCVYVWNYSKRWIHKI